MEDDQESNSVVATGTENVEDAGGNQNPNTVNKRLKTLPSKTDVIAQLRSGQMVIHHPKKKSASCWSVFGHPKVAGTDTFFPEYAVCIKCKYVYVYNSKKGNSQLNAHKCAEIKPTSQTNLRTFVTVNKTHDRSQPINLPLETKVKLNEAAVTMCAMDMRPLSILEGPGMVMFAQELVDTASYLGRFDVKSTISDSDYLSSKHLKTVYDKARADIINEMSKLDSICHTTDAWTDKYSGNCYMSLACFYITEDFDWRKIVWKTEKFDVVKKNAEAIKQWYLDSLNELKLDSLSVDRHYVVADNASVNGAAFRTLNGIGCSTHCINLVVNAMVANKQVPDAYRLFSSAKAIVTHVKKSNLQSRLPTRLVQSVVTRWNSSHKMLGSIAKVWVQLSQVLIDRDEAHYLTGLSLATIQAVVEFLKLFLDATNVLESDSHPNLHLVMFWYFRLERHLIDSNDDLEIIKSMKAIGRSALEQKWKKRLQPIHFAATLLDPRAKNSSRLTVQQKSDGKLLLSSLYHELDTDSVQEQNTTTNTVDSDEAAFYDSAETDLGATTELDMYLGEPVAVNVKKPTDLLEYWRGKKLVYPTMAKVAKAVFGIPASSATSERSFSDAGFTINLRRTTLKPMNVDKLIFMRSYLKLPILSGFEGDENEDEED